MLGIPSVGNILAIIGNVLVIIGNILVMIDNKLLKMVLFRVSTGLAPAKLTFPLTGTS